MFWFDVSLIIILQKAMDFIAWWQKFKHDIFDYVFATFEIIRATATGP